MRTRASHIWALPSAVPVHTRPARWTMVVMAADTGGSVLWKMLPCTLYSRKGLYREREERQGWVLLCWTLTRRAARTSQSQMTSRGQAMVCRDRQLLMGER
jgi:hypothetical protein